MTYNPETVKAVSNFSAFERLELYEEALELRRKYGWGSRRIGEELGIKASAIKNWIHNDASPVTHMNKPDFSKEGDLSYVAGVVEGDGWTTNYIEDDGTERHKIGLKATSKEFVEEFQNRARNLIGTITKIYRIETDGNKEAYEINFDNVLLYEFLEKREKQVNNITQRNPRPFLRGVFDSEASAKIQAGVVECYNTSQPLLEQCSNYLDYLGIESSIREKETKRNKISGRSIKQKKQLYVLTISSKSNVEKFEEEVGFSIPEKNNKIEKILE